MSIGYVCDPDDAIVLILSHYWMPIGITTAKEGVRKLIRESDRNRKNSTIFALDRHYNIKNWSQWCDSHHDEFYLKQPHLRSTKQLYPVPTVMLTTSKWVYKCSEKPTVRYMYKRYKGVCQICGERKNREDMTLEHILPKSLHGTNDDYNITMTCKHCNNTRGNIFPYASHTGEPLSSPRNLQGLHVFKCPREEWRLFGVTVFD